MTTSILVRSIMLLSILSAILLDWSPAAPASHSVKAGWQGGSTAGYTNLPRRLTTQEAIERALGGPAVPDGEVGADDFRISSMGFAPDTKGDANHVEIAYNSLSNEYLVVWTGDDGGVAPLTNDEYEIYGQRINAATGEEIGSDFRISDMGPDGDANFQASNPAVAYNSSNNQYLVVWVGDDSTDEEYEVFGQRISASSGLEVGTNDFRISDMGPNGDTAYEVSSPAVAYNSTNNQYLVTWRGEDNIAPLVDEEFEIFGQRLNASNGAEVGTNDFRISDMGPDGDTAFGVGWSAVAYNSQNNEYMVVWNGVDNTPPLVANEGEVFGQRINALTGAEVGTNDFRISDMGPDGNISYGAFNPDLAYNTTSNEYLVVWGGDDNTGLLVDGEFEVFGQRIDAASGAELGGDFRISEMGPDGSTNFSASFPKVAHNATNNEYLVVWHGDDDSAPLVDNEREIFGQRLSAAGVKVGTPNFRVSDMGPNGNTNYEAIIPAVAYNSQNNEYLVGWKGDDDVTPLSNNDFEILGQRLNAANGTDVGTNDFRISTMWFDQQADLQAYGRPAAAYNSSDDQYLVVWAGDQITDNEFEIYGQLLDAVTGAEIGGDFRISDMGPDGDSSFNAFNPAVAYNSTDNQYLVVWQGDDNTVPLVNGEIEIFGQRLDAAGAEIGTNDFRISSAGPDGDPNYDAENPAVAYVSSTNRYAVVWDGDDNSGTQLDNENEIFGRRVNAATGAVEGMDDFVISDMGADGNTEFDAWKPAVTHNPTENEIFVVWYGDKNGGTTADEEYEIYGQRISTVTGAQVGVNDFRISSMGANGTADFDALYPAVAYNSLQNEYLVAWQGDDTVDGEFEIYGQRLNASNGAPQWPDDQSLSSMGPGGDTFYGAFEPAVVYDSQNDGYLVAWYGDDDTSPLVDNEKEIFGVFLKGASGAVHGDWFRLSTMGPDGNYNYTAQFPALAFNSASGEILAAWWGNDNTPPLVEIQKEIFGQRLVWTDYVYVYLPLVNK